MRLKAIRGQEDQKTRLRGRSRKTGGERRDEKRQAGVRKR